MGFVWGLVMGGIAGIRMGMVSGKSIWDGEQEFVWGGIAYTELLFNPNFFVLKNFWCHFKSVDLFSNTFSK